MQIIIGVKEHGRVGIKKEMRRTVDILNRNEE